MKRLTIEGDWVHVAAGTPHERWHLYEDDGRPGAGVWLRSPVVHSVTVEDVPDPLPTEPGTHIVATVTRHDEDGAYPESVRTVLCRYDSWAWLSAAEVRGSSIHNDEHISDWTVLDVNKRTDS